MKPLEVDLVVVPMLGQVVLPFRSEAWVLGLGGVVE
jgi:hypothetical protein